jgi:uncharacterized membrane protein YhaH (DUF805 family)
MLVMIAVGTTIHSLITEDMRWISGLFLWVPIVALVPPTLAVLVRRLHDTNRSGFWLLIALIPLFNLIWIIVLLVYLCQPGTPGPNKFDLHGKSQA